MIVGKLLPSVSKQVIQKNINTYAEASGDYNPLHWDEQFAADATHYGRIVAHGMLILAYISEMMTQEFGMSWMEAGTLKVRFKAPVYPGDRVETFGKVVKLEEKEDGYNVSCSVGCRKIDGEDVIIGHASVYMPNISSGVEFA